MIYGKMGLQSGKSMFVENKTLNVFARETAGQEASEMAIKSSVIIFPKTTLKLYGFPRYLF